MSMCRVLSCVVGRGCLLWPVRFLGKTLLDFVLLHFYCKAKRACYVYLKHYKSTVTQLKKKRIPHPNILAVRQGHMTSLSQRGKQVWHTLNTCNTCKYIKYFWSEAMKSPWIFYSILSSLSWAVNWAGTAWWGHRGLLCKCGTTAVRTTTWESHLILEWTLHEPNPLGFWCCPLLWYEHVWIHVHNNKNSDDCSIQNYNSMAGIGNVFCESAVWGPRVRHICLCGGEAGSQRVQKSPPPQWKVNK